MLPLTVFVEIRTLKMETTCLTYGESVQIGAQFKKQTIGNSTGESS